MAKENEEGKKVDENVHIEKISRGEYLCVYEGI